MKTEDALRIPIQECGEPLEKVSPDEFVCVPVYFQRGVSRDARMRLRSGVIARLRKAKRHLPEGWSFKIWDGFRALETQRRLFEDYRAVLAKGHPGWTEEQLTDAAAVFISTPSADPNAVPPHNSGGAVDLTLQDAEGREVAMGTGFDAFIDRAGTAYFEKRDGQVHQNRMILMAALEEEGFVNYPEEWWHFDYGNQLWAMRTGAPFAVYGSMEGN